MNFLSRTIGAISLAGLLILAGPGQAQLGNAFSMSLYQSAYERGDLEAAEKHLNRVLKDSPTNIMALWQRSYLRITKGNLKGAKEDAELLVKEYPRVPLGHIALLGVTSMEATAEEHLKLVKAVRNKLDEDPITNLTLASHYHSLGELSEALELLESALDLLEAFPGNTDELKGRIASYKAILLYDSGKPEEAIRTLDAYLRQFPDNEEVKESRLEILLAEGRLQEALGSFQSLFKKRPKSSLNTWFDRAQAYYLTGEYAKARADLEEARRRAPADAHSPTLIGGILILEGKAAEAEAYLTKNLKIITRDKGAARRGHHSLMNRRQDLLTVDLLGISSHHPLYNRALARAVQGKRKEALQDATAAARGADPFPPYEPAEQLRAALESGATIRLNPKPVTLPQEDGGTTGGLTKK